MRNRGKNSLIGILSAERFEAPISLDSAQRREVCIVGVVRCVPQVLGETIAQDESINSVIDIIRLVFVKREQYNRAVVVKVRIREERG